MTTKLEALEQEHEAGLAAALKSKDANYAALEAAFKSKEAEYAALEVMARRNTDDASTNAINADARVDACIFWLVVFAIFRQTSRKPKARMPRRCGLLSRSRAPG
jgi:hypothetical protein